MRVLPLDLVKENTATEKQRNFINNNKRFADKELLKQYEINPCKQTAYKLIKNIIEKEEVNYYEDDFNEDMEGWLRAEYCGGGH